MTHNFSQQLEHPSCFSGCSSAVLQLRIHPDRYAFRPWKTGLDILVLVKIRNKPEQQLNF